MEGRGLEEDALQRKLRDSRHRFQRRMQQLIEKYNQPFEDDPLVQMATLTYQTPQGLKIWGGKLIKEGNKAVIQDLPGKLMDRMEGPRQAAAQGDTPPRTCTPALGTDSESSEADAALDQGSPVACALRGADTRGAMDTSKALVPFLASPATPVPGCCGSISAKSPGDLAQPAVSPREWEPRCPCPADVAAAPGHESPSLLGTSSSSCVSSQSFEVEDICNVTISDLYAGMLHSMSRLLSAKPSSTISTKTFIAQSWSARRRLVRRRKVRLRCSQGRSKERPAPCSEAGKKPGPLRGSENLLHVAQPESSLKLDKAFPAGHKAHLHTLGPVWKELQGTPQKHMSLTSLDLNTVRSLDQENRFRKLKWLISPVKIVSSPRVLFSHVENRYKEIEVRFNRLHQECCPSPGKQSSPEGPSGSWAVEVYRGGSVSPGGLQGLEIHRPSLPSSKAKAEWLSEASGNPGRRCVGVGRSPPKSGLAPLPKDSPSQSLGRSRQASDHSQGCNSGAFGKAPSPSRVIAAPRMDPLGCGKNRYNEIKEKFDQLHQKYCQPPPQRAKAPSLLRVSPDKAGSHVQSQTQELFRKANRGNLFQKLSLSPEWHRQSPWGSSEAHLSACSAHAANRDPQFPAKRRRLSDPQVCGHRASIQDSSERHDPAPDQGSRRTPQPDW